MLVNYQRFVDIFPLPKLNRALVMVTTLKPIRITIDRRLLIDCLQFAVNQITSCESSQATATSTQVTYSLPTLSSVRFNPKAFLDHIMMWYQSNDQRCDSVDSVSDALQSASTCCAFNRTSRSYCSL